MTAPSVLEDMAKAMREKGDGALYETLAEAALDALISRLKEGAPELVEAGYNAMRPYLSYELPFGKRVEPVEFEALESSQKEMMGEFLIAALEAAKEK